MHLHNSNLPREEMLKRLSILDFMVLDLGLYLNTCPEDGAALAIHTAVAADAEKLRKAYEASHGPLSARSSTHNNRWQWIDDPWPWDAEANFEIKEVIP